MHQPPEILRVNDHPKFQQQVEQLDMFNWMRLFRCKMCDQLWAINEPEKYSSQFAFKTASRDHWREVNFSPLEKQYIIQHQWRGGLTDEKCIYAECEGRRVKGVVYCVDHLYATGARE